VWATAWNRCQALMAAQCAAAGRLAVQRPVRCLLTLFLARVVFGVLVSPLHLTAAPCSVLVPARTRLPGVVAGNSLGSTSALCRCEHASCLSVAGSDAAS
jgi:hypothetical protein